ncbi:unnamed protein product [Owenia fusiformis]|uniref:Uncharacterized protein n=1 Tax=Owenia fusiformis TaxID=6347 RepID=A0A8J1UG84_OWEFU|nr:unnamed protein product [Owenia fusiformis]
MNRQNETARLKRNDIYNLMFYRVYLLELYAHVIILRHHAFTETNSLRYEEFAKIWRDRNMPTIYMGRQKQNELREMTEEVFRIAISYILPPFEIQVKVGALYMMYGLYFKQLTTPRVRFRVTVDNWRKIKEFHLEVQSQQHLDADYIFRKLVYENAFFFTATEAEMYPCLRPTSEDTDKPEKLGKQKSIIGELFESDNIEQLSAFHENYQQMKNRLTGDSKQVDESLNVIENQLVHYITRNVTSHEEWRTTGRRMRKKDGGITTSESEGDSDHEATVSDIGKSRASIRAKASTTMGASKNKSRRHRRPEMLSPDEDEPMKKKPNIDIDFDEAIKKKLSVPSVDVGPILKSALLSMPSFETEEEQTQVKGKGKGKGKKSPKSNEKKKQTKKDTLKSSTKPDTKSKKSKKTKDKEIQEEILIEKKDKKAKNKTKSMDKTKPKMTKPKDSPNSEEKSAEESGKSKDKTKTKRKRKSKVKSEPDLSTIDTSTVKPEPAVKAKKSKE